MIEKSRVVSDEFQTLDLSRSYSICNFEKDKMKEKQDKAGNIIAAIALGGIVSLVAPTLYIAAVLLFGDAESGILTLKKLLFISFMIFLTVFTVTLFSLRKRDV